MGTKETGVDLKRWEVVCPDGSMAKKETLRGVRKHQRRGVYGDT